ncbi:hypothetical protein MNBD_GAMMA10-1490, partial [hydrothermal vent metagenome]
YTSLAHHVIFGSTFSYAKKLAKDWAVFACKDDTLYRVPKAHNRATTPFLTTPIFINRLLSEAHFEASN